MLSYLRRDLVLLVVAAAVADVAAAFLLPRSLSFVIMPLRSHIRKT